MKKAKILFWTAVGECLKLLMLIRIVRPRYSVEGRHGVGCLTVSMTSYGRRVGKVLPYTIVSLLRQTRKPDAIVVWLDDSWNDNNLPVQLNKVRKYGVEIRYCKDIRSYKKLIPSLMAYPDDDIITADDDLYYVSSMIERLTLLQDDKCLYAMRTHAPRLANINGKEHLASYSDWDKETKNSYGLVLFPTSGGGVLYNRCKLHDDTCDENLFMKLCPYADDVWFYFMALMKGTQVVNVGKSYHDIIPLDNVYQLTHKGSRLADANCGKSQNDIQIESVMQYYGLSTINLRQ